MNDPVRRCAALLALLTTFAHPVPTWATPSDDLNERLGSAARQLEQSGYEGIVGIHVEGSGTAYLDLRSDDAADMRVEDTLVDVGSITKTVTAAMVMKLVETGRLSVDTTIGEILPDAPEDKSSITIHQLLTHSAGFPEAIGHDHEKLTRSGFLARALGRELEFEPGAQYRYSNVGYSLLAVIVEVVSQKSYEEYLKEDVLAGTGVTGIAYSITTDTNDSSPIAAGRGVAQASWGGDRPYWNLVGNGGLLMTVPAIVAFRRNLMAGEIVDAACVALMHRAHVREGPNAPSHYGYGLVVQEAPPFGRFYWHNGGNDLYSANWTDLVERDVLIVAAAGTAAPDADEAVMIAATALLELPGHQAGHGDDTQGSGELNPETTQRVRSLTSGFMQAVSSESSDRWERFLLDHGHTDFLAIAPMKGHLSVFRKFHDALLGFELQQVELSGPDEIVIRLRHPETGETKQAHLGFRDTGNGKLEGVRIRD